MRQMMGKALKDSLSLPRKFTPVSQSHWDCITQPTGCEVGQSGSDRATLGHASETGASRKGLNHPVRRERMQPFQG